MVILIGRKQAAPSRDGHGRLSDTQNQPLLRLLIPSVKADRLGLYHLLPIAIVFAAQHLLAGHRLLIADESGDSFL